MARRLAGVMLVTGLLSDLASRHWVLNTTWVYLNITTRLGHLLFWTGAVWLAYLALEPLARRAWPHWLTAWTRLLDGRWRDPPVGQSLLSGILFGTLLATTYALPQIGGRLLSLQGASPGASPLFDDAGIGPLYPAAQYLSTVVGCADNVKLSLMAVAFMVIVRLVLRSDRAAFAAAAVVITLRAFGPEHPLPLSWVSAGIVGVCSVVFLRRYGLLALAAAYTVAAVVSITPWTLDVTKWFAWRPMLTTALVLALTIWGFRNVLGRQSAFPTGALDG